MKTACEIMLGAYGIFVVVYLVHCYFAWRETERLHRMAAADRAKRQHEYGTAGRGNGGQS
jgi:hypothetical protein